MKRRRKLPEKFGQKCANISICTLHLVVIKLLLIFIQRKYFFFSFFTPESFTRQDASVLVRSLLMRSRKRLARVLFDTFSIQSFQHCSWRHWYWLLGTECQHLRSCFRDSFFFLFLNKQNQKSSENWCVLILQWITPVWSIFVSSRLSGGQRCHPYFAVPLWREKSLDSVQKEYTRHFYSEELL